MAKTKKVSKLKDDSKWAWLMLAPNIIGFLLFMLIPMVATFVLSFTKYDMLSTPKFVGLQNYIDMVKDPIIWEEYHCVYNTYCSCWDVHFLTSGGYAGSEDCISKILSCSVLSSFNHFYGSCSDRMAVDLQSGLRSFELFSVSVWD